jgi:hypothetical protein
MVVRYELEPSGPVDLYEELLLICLRIPAVLEQADKVSNASERNEPIPSVQELWKEASQLDVWLKQWLRKLHLSSKGVVCVEKPSISNIGIPSLHFVDLYTAQLYLVYWTSLIFLYTARLQIHSVGMNTVSDAYELTFLSSNIIFSTNLQKVASSEKTRLWFLMFWIWHVQFVAQPNSANHLR